MSKVAKRRIDDDRCIGCGEYGDLIELRDIPIYAEIENKENIHRINEIKICIECLEGILEDGGLIE